MSNVEDKEKRVRRLQGNKNAIKKQIRIIKVRGGHSRYEREPHRLVKHHAMDCGNPQCSLCGNPRKLYGLKTPQELKLEQNMDTVRDIHSNGLIVEEVHE
jgi:hypothetical protein